MGPFGLSWAPLGGVLSQVGFGMRSSSELEATWGRLGAILGPPWAALGLSWASLGRVLEPLGALSGALEALSGALGAVLGPACGSLRRLKTQIGEMSKTYNNL